MHYRTCLAALAAIAISAAIPAGAMQDDDTDAAEVSDRTDGRPGDTAEDVIVIYGEGKPRGPAMDAFLRGDYETAEAEFEINLRCVRRQEMLAEFAYESAASAAVDAEVNAAGGFGGGGSGGFGQSTNAVDPAYNATRPEETELVARSCEREDWQLYMIALSQLQLGKYAEAKANFYKVINISNDPQLYDAHYRIALLELMDGNIEEADQQLRQLQIQLERCQRRGDRCIQREEMEESVAYLEKAVALAKDGVEIGTG